MSLQSRIIAPQIVGAALVVLYTLCIAGVDSITKHIAETYEAPQLFAVGCGVVVLLSLVTASFGAAPVRRQIGTGFPIAMALRCAFAIAACIGFYYAFRLLPFAEVFIFIGLTPILAGLLSNPVLGERLGIGAWAALTMGCLGVLMLFGDGLGAITSGHVIALLATIAGTLSIVLTRWISQRETTSLAQVFWPNLAIFLCMAAVAPMVWKPMPLVDIGWALAYGATLFVSRWICVLALERLSAHAVVLIMNLQFVWMVVMGWAFFAEWPTQSVVAGALLICLSGFALVAGEVRRSIELDRRTDSAAAV